MLAFERAGGDAGDAYALVVFNTNPNHPSTPAFDTSTMKTSDAAFGKVLVDVLSPDKTTYTVGADGSLSITLPPTSGAILVPEDQVNPKL